MRRAAVVLLLALTGCASNAGGAPPLVARATVVPTLAPTLAPTPPPSPPIATVIPTPPATPRVVTADAWTPFATVGGVTLRHPSSRVERVAFHEANHDGARQLEVLPTAINPVTMQTRNRNTGSRSAADVIADPGVEIRAPVTGVVKRAGTYVLYCKYSDDYVVINPDDHPGWEVKVLHIDHEQVTVGQRVIAGETVLAARPTVLPFKSQTDEYGAQPPWPHVHMEVVDPSIPNKPSPGEGCN